MKVILSLLITAFTIFCASAKQSKYEGLVNKNFSLPTARLMQSADSLSKVGADEQAIVLYMIVASRSEKHASEYELAMHIRANLNIGDIHYAKGNYSDAMKHYMVALKISDSHPDKPLIAVLYKNIGNVYNEFHDYDIGISIYNKGLKYARERGDSDTEYKLLQNLCAASIRLGDVDEARRYYEHIPKVKHTPSDNGLYMEKFILALIMHGEHRYDESIAQFNSLAAFAREKICRQGTNAMLMMR